MDSRLKISPLLLSLINEYEQCLENGVDLYLNDKEYHNIIKYYDAESDFDRALEVIDNAIKQYSYRSDFLNLKARILIKRGRLDYALEVINRCEVIAPHDSEVLLLKAQVYIYQKKWSEASEIIQDLKSFVTKSELEDVIVTEAFFFENIQEYQTMFDSLKKALILNPNNEEALEMMNTAVERSKNFEESILIHKVIVDNHPYNSLAWYNLGHSYGNVGEYEKAIDALEYAFIINPSFESAYHDCAEYCKEISQHERALDIYNEAEEVFGEEFDVLLYKAQCQYKLGLIDHAKRSLFIAIEIDCYNDEALFLLAQCHMAAADWNSAIKVLKKALAIENQVEEYFHSLGNCYRAVGNLDRAKYYLKKAAQKSFEVSKYWEDYISFLISTEAYQEAKETLVLADKYTFSYTLQYLEAFLIIAMGNDKEGFELLEDVLDESITEHVILQELPICIRENSKILAMIEYYKQDKN
jgi:tetratricopeptide (TPR) repeat protein